jgi:integrase/recombinase XerD
MSRGSHKREFKREPLTQDEANAIAQACSNAREKLVIWTLLDTGLRVQEFASLTKSNIDWQQHRIALKGKGGKRRVVMMTDRIRPLVEQYIGLNDCIGIAARTVQTMVHRVASRAKISRPVSPHVLRHTFAVTALQKGLSLPALQKLLGHEDLQTTAIYLNMSGAEALREFTEKW